MNKNYFLLVALLISSLSFGQVLEENFDYGMTNGDLTAASGGAWAQHSGTSDPVQYVATPSLTMTGYPSSGIGGHVSVSGTSQDVNRSFSGISSGTVYGSALVNLSAVGSGNYFMHFNIAGGFTTRIGARDDGSGGVQFGVGTSSSTLTYGTTSYALNTTYLLVFSYEVSSGVSNLHVLSAVTATEPAMPEATNTGTTGRTISAIAIRQSNNIPTFLIDGIRVAESWTEIMNNSSIPSVSIVTPGDGATFDPGTSSVDVSFTVQNLDLMVAGNQVNITVNSDPTDTDVSSPYAVPTMNGGMYSVTVELLENNIVIDTKMVSFSVASITQVSSITELRNGNLGDYYELDAEAIISYIVTENTRNQKYIQDSGAGILIDDTAGTLSTTLAAGDGIFGLQGQLSQFSGVLQFVPISNLPGASSSGNSITPLFVTANELATNGEAYESRLIRVLNVEFSDMGNFADNTNYTVTTAGGSDTTVCRASFGDEDLIGTAIPAVPVDIIGLGGEFNGSYQVLPRFSSDIDTTLSTEEFGTTEFNMYPNPATGNIVTIASASNNTKDVQVYSILGKQVINTTITNTLNIADLQSGVYVVKITDNGKSATKKLVIK
ncbi:T9SS type A sorting domain-containing protein [Kordia sp.]|uniref:T9SS type A sorting domain-containing protein n=1 Tax=Kordia sp. TaxID=1965332 RepID=UPI0025B85E29|nr:T9SS type A sorting domain-containing protein [Kordia sp.]MCH2192524.1 T9SS type A sorting domain-containing protein [Kordia sp.]